MATITQATEWDLIPELQRTTWFKDRVRELQAKTHALEGKVAANEFSLKEALEAIVKLEDEVARLKAK